MDAGKISFRLKNALREAKGLDNWHKYGEGYGYLWAEVVKLIDELDAEQAEVE